MQCSKIHAHSITSSARASSKGGTWSKLNASNVEDIGGIPVSDALVIKDFAYIVWDRDGTTWRGELFADGLQIAMQAGRTCAHLQITLFYCNVGSMREPPTSIRQPIPNTSAALRVRHATFETASRTIAERILLDGIARRITQRPGCLGDP